MRGTLATATGIEAHHPTPTAALPSGLSPFGSTLSLSPSGRDHGVRRGVGRPSLPGAGTLY